MKSSILRKTIVQACCLDVLGPTDQDLVLQGLIPEVSRDSVSEEIL
jgi:hypothetical protein